ncbi:MAG: prolipoprotein diacylglyceryl transferase [Candidatus Omnitrophota bacterium]
MHPILFSIGRINVYSYGFVLAIAFLISLYLASGRARIFKIPEEFINNLALVLLVSGIIGARTLYVFMNAGYFSKHFSEIFMIQRGGLVFYGAAIAAFFSGAVFIRIKRFSVLETSDLIAPFIALAHGMGRIGCFLNGCCYGRPTHSFIGVMFPFTDVKVYPTQIFSFVGLVILFLFLFNLQNRRRFNGEVFFSYLIGYGIFRFFIDFLRGDLYPVFLGLTVTQLISIAIAITAGFAYLLAKKKSPLA